MENKIEDFIDIHLNGQLNLYVSNIIRNENYNIYYNKFIDDEYWNFAFVKNNNIFNYSNEIKNDMKNINRQPIIYTISDIKSNNMNLMYTDVWMTFDDIKLFRKYKSNLNVSFSIVDNLSKNDFIQAVITGFSGDNPNDPYSSLSEGYSICLRESFNKKENEYKIINYLGKYNNEIVSTATVIFKNDKAIIYNITTNKRYQRNGICKELLSYVSNNLLSLGIKSICIQTERGFYTEQVYKNMGFKELMLGKAYLLED